MTEFKFVDDVPADGRGNYNRQLITDFAAALRDRPGQWAEYPITPPSAHRARTRAHGINHGITPLPLRDPRFEAVSRKGLVYVRFVASA